MFSIYLLQLSQCFPSLFHMSATPNFSFHLKQVQNVTTPSNLDSLEGEAGEGRRVGVLKEGDWGKRGEEKQVKSSKEPLPCISFSISYAWLFVFPGWLSLPPQLVSADVFHATPGPLGRLHPLAKRRTYWLSWTSENKSKAQALELVHSLEMSALSSGTKIFRTDFYSFVRF